uniref:WD_REPEATS_REGION domain-containing protein n=1 Tax=Macrostomum lignano TaxID=282301 RepID=A0A1I8G0D3_9PLAT
AGPTVRTVDPGSSEGFEAVRCVSWNRQVAQVFGAITEAAAGVSRLAVYDTRRGRDGSLLPLMQLTAADCGLSSGQLLTLLEWHPGMATQLCLASDDNQRSQVQLWDLRFATSPVTQFNGHAGASVLSMAWSEFDTGCLLSSDSSGGLLCWDPKPIGGAVGSIPDATGADIVEPCQLIRAQFEGRTAQNLDWCPSKPGLFSASTSDGQFGIYNILGGGFGIVDLDDKDYDGINEGQLKRLRTPSAAEDPFAKVRQPLGCIRVQYNPARPFSWLLTSARCGASFGFGGRLVSFGGQPGHVTIGVLNAETIGPVDSLIARRAAEFESALANAGDELGSLRSIESSPRQSDCNASNSNSENLLWRLLEANFSTNPRSDFIRLLGYGEDDDECQLDGNETDDLIVRALVSGRVQLSVDLCVANKRYCEALLLASISDGVAKQSQLFSRTRTRVLSTLNNYDSISSLVGTVVSGNIVDYVRNAGIDWKQRLAVVLSFVVNNDESAALIDSIGHSLIDDENSKQQRNSASIWSAAVCYACSGSWRRLVHSLLLLVGNDSTYSSLIGIQLALQAGEILRRAVGSNNATASSVAISDAFVERYAWSLTGLGELSAALNCCLRQLEDRLTQQSYSVTEADVKLHEFAYRLWQVVATPGTTIPSILKDPFAERAAINISGSTWFWLCTTTAKSTRFWLCTTTAKSTRFWLCTTTAKSTRFWLCTTTKSTRFWLCTTTAKSTRFWLCTTTAKSTRFWLCTTTAKSTRFWLCTTTAKSTRFWLCTTIAAAESTRFWLCTTTAKSTRFWLCTTTAESTRFWLCTTTAESTRFWLCTTTAKSTRFWLCTTTARSTRFWLCTTIAAAESTRFWLCTTIAAVNQVLAMHHHRQVNQVLAMHHHRRVNQVLAMHHHRQVNQVLAMHHHRSSRVNQVLAMHHHRSSRVNQVLAMHHHRSSRVNQVLAMHHHRQVNQVLAMHHHRRVNQVLAMHHHRINQVLAMHHHRSSRVNQVLAMHHHRQVNQVLAMHHHRRVNQVLAMHHHRRVNQVLAMHHHRINQVLAMHHHRRVNQVLAMHHHRINQVLAMHHHRSSRVNQVLAMHHHRRVNQVLAMHYHRHTVATYSEPASPQKSLRSYFSFPFLKSAAPSELPLAISTASLAASPTQLITAESFDTSQQQFLPANFSLAYRTTHMSSLSPGAQCYNPLVHLPTAATQALPPKPPPTNSQTTLSTESMSLFREKLGLISADAASAGGRDQVQSQFYNPTAWSAAVAAQTPPPASSSSAKQVSSKPLESSNKPANTTGPVANELSFRLPAALINLSRDCRNRAENLLRMTPPGGSAVKWRHMIVKMNDAEKRATALAKLLANGD